MTTTAVGSDERGHWRCRACQTVFETYGMWVAHLRMSRHKQ